MPIKAKFAGVGGAHGATLIHISLVTSKEVSHGTDGEPANELERARALIVDEQHWCRGELARET
jgi:hypothetical protein